MRQDQLVPELVVTNLEASLRFWRGVLGFAVGYERPEDGFAFIERAGVAFMLEERRPGARTWETGPLEAPLGRGINFEITTGSIEPLLSALREAEWPLFLEPEEKRYRVGEAELGVRQFLVQDPDGYLLRFAEDIGQRPATST